MRTYRRAKNELDVRAWQWYPHQAEVLGVCRCEFHIAAHVHSLSGIQLIREGDWVVQAGDVCFVVPDATFRIMFAPVDESEDKGN